MNAADIASHARADADTLRIAADGVTAAADQLDQGGDEAVLRLAAQALTRASLNALVSALGVARKSGQLEALADVEAGD